MALRCYDQRSADPRRRGGILHRLAWTAREAEQTKLEQQYLELARADYGVAFEKDERLTEGGALTLSYLLGELPLRLNRADLALPWFERTLRLERTTRHPEIARLTRDRWSDARAMHQESA